MFVKNLVFGYSCCATYIFKVGCTGVVSAAVQTHVLVAFVA